jgi:hypothetical protein
VALPEVKPAEPVVPIAEDAVPNVTVERVVLKSSTEAAALAFAIKVVQAQSGTPAAETDVPAPGEPFTISSQPAENPETGGGSPMPEPAPQAVNQSLNDAAPERVISDRKNQEPQTRTGESTWADGKPVKPAPRTEDAPTPDKKTGTEPPRQGNGMPAHSNPAGLGASERGSTPERGWAVRASSGIALTEPKAVTGQPANRIDLRFHGSGGEHVDIRLIAKQDAVQVAVRSSASGLTNDLRDGLHDLVQSLRETGYQADTWRPPVPAIGQVSLQAGLGSEQQRTFDGGGNGRQDASGWQHHNNEGGKGQSDRNAPDWVEELEASFAGSTQREGREK